MVGVGFLVRKVALVGCERRLICGNLIYVIMHMLASYFVVNLYSACLCFRLLICNMRELNLNDT